MDFPKPEMVKTNGISMAVHRSGPGVGDTSKPAVVFMHGWPELSYSWRNQLEAIGKAGYPCFAPDMRGFGKSECPKGADKYDMEHLSGDMTGVLDHYGIEKAVFVGHDWGALVLWGMLFYCRDRMLGAAGLNVGYRHDYPIDPVAMMSHGLGEDMYIVQFQRTDGEPERILEADVAKSVRFFMRRTGTDNKFAPAVFEEMKGLALLKALQMDESDWGGEPLLSDEEMAIYEEAYSRNGYESGINYYRNLTKNWQDKRDLIEGGVNPVINIPCLMITADRDAACPPRLADGMEDYFPNYTRVDLKDCGHWSQQEQAGNVNAGLLSWLEGQF